MTDSKVELLNESGNPSNDTNIQSQCNIKNEDKNKVVLGTNDDTIKEIATICSATIFSADDKFDFKNAARNERKSSMFTPMFLVSVDEVDDVQIPIK